MLLETPFGNIIVKLNDEPCNYKFEKLPNVVFSHTDGEPLWSVEGRYKIIPIYESPLHFPLRVKIIVDTSIELGELSEIEAGERYTAASMYYNGMKLCIGCYDDIEPDFEYGKGWVKVVGGGCVHWSNTPTSLEIYVGEEEYMEYAYFGVAWTTLNGNDFENNGDIDVWFLAEPAMM